MQGAAARTSAIAMTSWSVTRRSVSSSRGSAARLGQPVLMLLLLVVVLLVLRLLVLAPTLLLLLLLLVVEVLLPSSHPPALLQHVWHVWLAVPSVCHSAAVETRANATTARDATAIVLKYMIHSSTDEAKAARTAARMHASGKPLRHVRAVMLCAVCHA